MWAALPTSEVHMKDTLKPYLDMATALSGTGPAWKGRPQAALRIS